MQEESSEFRCVCPWVEAGSCARRGSAHPGVRLLFPHPLRGCPWPVAATILLMHRPDSSSGSAAVAAGNSPAPASRVAVRDRRVERGEASHPRRDLLAWFPPLGEGLRQPFTGCGALLRCHGAQRMAAGTVGGPVDNNRAMRKQDPGRDAVSSHDCSSSLNLLARRSAGPR
jgi:hypothetical protein